LVVAACSWIKIPNHFNNTQCPCYYPLSKCQTSLKKPKKKGIKKDTKEKIACKLVAAEASTLCITLNFVVLPILNNCSKRKVLQSEKLLVEHANDKLQMHG
jgi:hypothetical protein